MRGSKAKEPESVPGRKPLGYWPLGREALGRWADLGGERGQLGGVEAIPFGILVLVVGTLLVVNAWGVIDAKLACEAAAREAARAYVEAPDESSALARAHSAAEEAIAGHGREPGNARISAPGLGSFARCQRVVYQVDYDVPTLHLPWVGGLGGSVLTASARHSEVVDPYRSGLEPGQGAGCVP